VNSISAAPKTDVGGTASRGRESSQGLARAGEDVLRKLEEIQAQVEGGGCDAPRLREGLDSLHEIICAHDVAAREMSSLCHFLQQHSEREKAALARELHDALGGILTPAKMDLAWLMARLGSDPEFASRMARLNALIDQGIDLKRRIIEDLRPSLLDHLGLSSALQWYVDEACRDAGLECRLTISDQLERLSPDLEIALYRLVQEGVGNVVKHARAGRLDLTIERTAKGLNVVMADNGIGIRDMEHAQGLSHGLAGMMHRVRSVDGTFDIDSQPGEGTRIRVFVPLA
jgi:signal transduction histidine kinase